MKEKLTEEEKKIKQKENYKKWYEKNKEKRKKYFENYYIENCENYNNSENYIAYQKEYKQTTKYKEYQKEYQKIYQKKYKNEYNKDYHKKYRENNKDYLKELRKKYLESLTTEQKEQIRIKRNEKQKERRENDPLYKLKGNTSSLIRQSLKLKGYLKESRTHEILGCSFEDLKTHLEKQFTDWMTWENYGNPKDGIYEPNKTWDIDHIIPLSSANNEKELLELCNYLNLRPLCSHHNRWVKKDK